MLSNNDVKTLIEVFVTKSDLKEQVRNLATKEDFNNLLTAVDAYAKKADTYFQHVANVSRNIDSQKKQIQRLSKKLRAQSEC